MFPGQIQCSIYLLKRWEGNFKLALSVRLASMDSQGPRAKSEFYSKDRFYSFSEVSGSKGD